MERRARAHIVHILCVEVHWPQMLLVPHITSFSALKWFLFSIQRTDSTGRMASLSLAQLAGLGWGKALVTCPEFFFAQQHHLHLLS